MAEARSAVCDIRVLPKSFEEGKNSLKDFFTAGRKFFRRSYFRLRNSIRNGTWPTSIYNLFGAFCISVSLLLLQPDSTKLINDFLWNIKECLYLPIGTPSWVIALIISCLVSVIFFVCLMTIRQYFLRILLSYRGWMYEPIQKSSMKSWLWGLLVKFVSGYQPSLYSCQRSLPRLPVPLLQDTIEKLLTSLEPVVTVDELQVLQAQSQEFLENLGPKLQKRLLLKSWWAPNYVSDWWEKYVYLLNRSPLAINSNYYALDHSYWRPTSFQVSRTANVLYSLLGLYRKIDREELAPLLIRNTIPICMAQYERLFSSTRIPGEEQDELVHYDSSDSRHVIVISNGIYYKLDVYDSHGQILFPTLLEELLQWIISDSKDHQGEYSNEMKQIGALTTLDRRSWAKLRSEWFTSGVNKESLDSIEKAICVISLCDEVPKSLDEKGKILLCGWRSCLWYDKCSNLVFFGDGSCGMNVEHTSADAPVMGHIWEYIMTAEVLERRYTPKGLCMPLAKGKKQGSYKMPVRTLWEIEDPLRAAIQNSILLHQKNSQDLDLEIFDHNEWGKGVIKKCDISPDAFIQMALQMAYFKDSGRFCQTYEASMTRLYLNGRTETVRSCTNEAKNFVLAMHDNSVSQEQKKYLLHEASNKHQQLYRDAMNGKGVDRHLFALYVLSKGLGYESPFLQSVLLRPWTLSTSQQPQQQQHPLLLPDVNHEQFRDMVCPGGGFGPVSDDGYGISYMMPTNDKIFFHVSSKFSCGHTSSIRFVEHISTSLREMKQLFCS